MNEELRAALDGGNLRDYIDRELIRCFKATPEYQAMLAEWQAEEDRIINGTGEDGPGISPELREMLSRSGIYATPQAYNLPSRLVEGALIRPSDLPKERK